MDCEKMFTKPVPDKELVFRIHTKYSYSLTGRKTIQFFQMER